MPCNECNPCDECNPCPEGDNTCNCPAKDMSTDCTVYTGDDLTCSGIEQNTVLTSVLQRLDAFICDKFEEAIEYLRLVNVGDGAKVFARIGGTGNKELRTVKSANLTLVDVIENTDTIDITPGVPSLSLNSTTDILSLIVTTLAGATTFASIDLSEYNYDTFVQSASFDSGTLELTITRNNGEPDIVVPLDFLNKYVTAGTYTENSNTITLTLEDSSTVDIDLSTLVSEILTVAADADTLDGLDSTAFAKIAGDTFTGPVEVPEEAYDEATWNGSLETPTKNAVRDKIESLNTRPYLVYSAMLNQSGVLDPVATVMENTLGGSIVWSRYSDGQYSATLTSAFTTDKTWVNLSSSTNINDSQKEVELTSIDVISIKTAFNSGVSADSVLSNTAIEIRVYP